MKRYYRIVRDTHNGYEWQQRQWWCPFWFRRNNSWGTEEKAEAAARTWASDNAVVKYLGKLP